MFRSCLLLSLAVVGCCYYPSKAEAIKLPNIASSNKFILHTYTHISTPKIEPATSFAQFDKAYKLAGVCFLGFGECGDVSFGKGDDNYDLDGDVMCQAEGYNVTACTVPSYLYNQCPYDPKYYKSCKEDTDKACKDAGYVSSCADGYIKDETQICPYSDSYYKCKCNPCDGYSYTLSEATADGYVTDGSCNSCGTTKYKRKNNPCTGYLTCECGGEIGTPTCKSGTVTKYQTCKTCCEYKCSEASCPEGYICEIETCSNKYCIIGCDVNYTDWCIQPITDCGALGYTKTADQCPNGYLKCPYGETVFCLSQPQIGDILYSDMSTSTDIISGKTAIGVVFDPYKRLAVALNQSGYSYFGGYLSDVSGLTNCGASENIEDYDSSNALLCDIDGKANTAKIIDFTKASGKSFPAAEYCYNYTTAGTEAGDWWLPSLYELNTLMSNKTSVNNTLQRLEKTILNTTATCGYWSSTEADSYAQ